MNTNRKLHVFYKKNKRPMYETSTIYYCINDFAPTETGIINLERNYKDLEEILDQLKIEPEKKLVDRVIEYAKTL